MVGCANMLVALIAVLFGLNRDIVNYLRHHYINSDIHAHTLTYTHTLSHTHTLTRKHATNSSTGKQNRDV